MKVKYIKPRNEVNTAEVVSIIATSPTSETGTAGGGDKKPGQTDDDLARLGTNALDELW